MKITGFIWFDDVIEKIETEHHVTMAEVEEVFDKKTKFKKMRKGKFRGRMFTERSGKLKIGAIWLCFSSTSLRKKL